MRRRSTWLVAPSTLAIIAAFAGASTARAHGDPASDYLEARPVYLPIDIEAAATRQRQLLATVQSATQQGFVIRVAIITSAYDLGAVPSLWKKPETYARFLGTELGPDYVQRLLIVMPNGLGFYWEGHDANHAYAVLGRVHVRAGPDGLVDTARAGVAALAAAAGIKAQAADPGSSNNRDRVTIVVLAVALTGAMLLARFALRRRR